MKSGLSIVDTGALLVPLTAITSGVTPDLIKFRTEPTATHFTAAEQDTVPSPLRIEPGTQGHLGLRRPPVNCRKDRTAPKARVNAFPPSGGHCKRG
jgi:hypothetical protein